MVEPAPSDPAPSLQVEARDGTLRLRLAGRFEGRRLGRVWLEAVTAVEQARADVVVVDAGEVAYCDAAGAALLIDIEDVQRRRGAALRVERFPETFQPILDLLRRARAPARTPPEHTGWIEGIGRNAIAIARDAWRLIAFVGELAAALAAAVVRPRRVRWKDAFRAAQVTGVNSLPVVLLVSLLLGLVLGFQSANQLHRFGADLFLADLIGLSVIRELGPLMTAIVLTARSGSAFAAELGTMRINEEVDALDTMGIDPVRFLVAPRVIAAVLMTPILTVFANLAGVAGGAIVWVFTLDLALPAYIGQLQASVDLGDVAGGLAKSVVFGLLVAGVGCLRGLATHGGPAGVGRSTTSAVVSGIVLLALADTLFTFVFHLLDI